MVSIERATVYRVEGRDFPTLKAAADHVDNLAAEIIKRAAMAKGFALSETVRLTEAILSVRDELAPLLVIYAPDANGDDE